MHHLSSGVQNGIARWTDSADSHRLAGSLLLLLLTSASAECSVWVWAAPATNNHESQSSLRPSLEKSFTSDQTGLTTNQSTGTTKLTNERGDTQGPGYPESSHSANNIVPHQSMARLNLENIYHYFKWLFIFTMKIEDCLCLTIKFLPHQFPLPVLPLKLN